ncbi:branched-chain amino acid transport system substrate-binding protein [Palleronia aestuarii]|uniref:Branched-chain amino acid transport system substrate-binding protein n=1 Tax=Palleronia aestuarii TaxID=568105 RepID=A0A2W7MWN4_9RHOB|nr:ABC transporter substrate-binding protein [Palleronia aestuarii]PZX10557.1 branched-chain amino acid transport system substrate-binding protein [Palleronia aestuarii]
MRAMTTVTSAVAVAAGLVAPAAHAEISIGVVNSLSGAFATFGERYRDGMQVALDEINENGGIDGETVSLVVRDDASEARNAITSLEELGGMDVPLVLGSYASSITGPMAQIANRREVPLVVLGSADDAITKPGSEWVFRAKHNTTIIGETYFDFFDAMRTAHPDTELQSVGMLYGNSAFPTALAEIARSEAEERGYEVVADNSYDQGVSDFRPILNNFLSAEPDILFLVNYADDGIAIIRQMAEVGLSASIIAIDTAAALPAYIEQTGDLSEYVVTAVDWSKDVQYEGTQDLYERLKAQSGAEPSFYEAEGYLALMVAAEALRQAGSTDRTEVREALDGISDFQTPVTSVTFEDYDGFQNQNPIQDLILQIQDGAHVTIYPEELSAGDPRFPVPAWSER